MLDNLEGDIRVLVFYRGTKDEKSKQQVKQAFSMYKEYSSAVKLQMVDAYVENQLADQYLKGVQDSDQVIIFIEYGDKKTRVESPYDEQNITSAMIKATRMGTKKVYFLGGHGERDLNSEDQEGLALFKQSLEDASFEVHDFKLFETKAVPEDADIVAIVGPKLQIMEGERMALKEFAEKGGRIFIAADPGEKHQVALLTKLFGIEYRNNYILDVGLNRLLGRGMAGILGLVFDSANEITKKFIGREGFTIFDKVSEVVAAPDAVNSEIKTNEIVKSAPSSFIVNELSNVKPPKSRGSHSLAVVAEGRFGAPKEDKDKTDKHKEFAVVVFGDSDFVAQKDIVNGFNIDLALNAIAYLAKETDLISIKPKAPAGTQLTLTSVQSKVIVILGLIIPLIFVSLTGIMWFRRRGA